MVPKHPFGHGMAGGPSRPRRSRCLLLPAKGPPLRGCRTTVSEPPRRPPLLSTLPLAFHRAVPIADCRRPAVKGCLFADPESCHLPERQQIPGAAMFPEACFRSVRGRAAGEGEERRGAWGSDPGSHRLSVGGVPPRWPCGRGGSRVPRWGVGVGGTCISQGEWEY